MYPEPSKVPLSEIATRASGTLVITSYPSSPINRVPVCDAEICIGISERMSKETSPKMIQVKNISIPDEPYSSIILHEPLYQSPPMVYFLFKGWLFE